MGRATSPGAILAFSTGRPETPASKRQERSRDFSHRRWPRKIDRSFFRYSRAGVAASDQLSFSERRRAERLSESVCVCVCTKVRARKSSGDRKGAGTTGRLTHTDF